MKKLYSVLLVLIIAFQLPAQTEIYHEPFNDDALTGWTATSTGMDNWNFDSDGTAENAIGWGSRPAIISPSDEGDDIDNLGVAALEVSSTSSATYILTSSNIDCIGQSDVYLRFNQYFGVQTTPLEIFVEVSNDEGGTWTAFDLSTNNALDNNEETTPWNVQEIDISSVADDQNILIRFFVSGAPRFWIIDDVYVYADRPAVDPIPYFGDSLELFGKPYDLDSTGWPFVPYQIVVEFAEGTTELEKQNIRDTLGFAVIDTCVCNKLELWQIDGNGQLGQPFDINERVMGARSKSKVNSADVNAFNFNELKDTIFNPADTLLAVPNGVTATPDNAVVIAVLDTGVDFAPNAPLTPNIWRNDLPSDSTCYEDDFIGWNFVHNNNNPSDDHSHGTHVAGIIAQTFPDTGLCDYRIMPIKTHDQFGTSTLFSVTCGTYYAVRAGANIINDSWGAYGKESQVLGNAVRSADDANVLIVTSAGNDALELGAGNLQYPACYDSDNIITVASVVDGVNGLERSDFSNFDSTLVDVLAFGDDVLSFVPGGGMDTKSGTSQATPAVAAIAAFAFCNLGENDDARNCVLDKARRFPASLGSYASGGRVLNEDSLCFRIVSISDGRYFQNTSFELFPNPTTQQINLRSNEKEENIHLRILDVSGRVLIQKNNLQMEMGVPISVDVSNLPQGMYLLQLYKPGAFWTERLLKNEGN